MNKLHFYKHDFLLERNTNKNRFTFNNSRGDMLFLIKWLVVKSNATIKNK